MQKTSGDIFTILFNAARFMFRELPIGSAWNYLQEHYRFDSRDILIAVLLLMLLLVEIRRMWWRLWYRIGRGLWRIVRKVLPF